MIKITSQTDQALTSLNKQYSSLIGSIILIVVGVVMGVLGMIGESPEWIMIGIGAAALVIGIAILLFRATYTYTFDKANGTFTVKTSGILRNGSQSYPLSDVSQIVKWRQVRRNNSSNESQQRQIVMHYILEFQNGEQITLAKEKQRSHGLLSMFYNSVTSGSVPQPIQTIADFLDVTIVSENQNPAEAIKDAVGGFTGQ